MNWERFQIAAEVGFRKLEIDIEVMFIPERRLLEFTSKMVQVFQQRQSCLMKRNSQLEGVEFSEPKTRTVVGADISRSQTERSAICDFKSCF